MKYLILKSEDVFDFWEKLTYGINTVVFYDEESMEKTKKCIEVANLICGFETVRFRKHVEHGIDYSDGDSNGVFNPKEIEGVFDIIWTDRGAYPVRLTDDDLSIEHFAQTAKNFEKIVEFNVHPSLIKHAKKIAKKYGVKFKWGTSLSFSGLPNKKSLYSQIWEAYKESKPSISFSKQYAVPQSIRVYASSLSVEIGKKIRVSVEGDVTTVYFKESSKEDIARGQLRKVVGNILEDIGYASAEDVYNDIGAEFFSKQPKPTTSMISDAELGLVTPETKQITTLTQTNDFDAVTAVNPESKQMFIVDPNNTNEDNRPDDWDF